MIMACLPSSWGLLRSRCPPPREEVPSWAPRETPTQGDARPHPLGATAGVVGCLRGRMWPLLGGGEAGPSLEAFPFSAVDNLLDDTMEARRRRRRSGRQEDEGEMGGEGSGPPSYL